MHKIDVDDLKPGMKFDKPILHSSGKVLLSADTELTDGIIKILKGRGVGAVYTELEPYERASKGKEPRKKQAKGYIQRRAKLTQVKPGMELAGPVYKDRKVLIERGVVLTDRHLSQLKEWGIEQVQVKESGSEVEKLREEREKAKSVCREIHSQAMDVVKESIDSVLSGNLVDSQAVEASVKGIVEQASADKDMLINLAGIKSMDNYLFSHSVGVAIYSVVIGLGLGYKENDLTALGIAALLHDIGMTKIPPHILSRNGPLSAQEYNEVKKHTLYGTFMAKDKAPLSKQIKNVISRHHERYDGSGYPKGLRGSEIDEYSQIVGLADTFEALTSPRAYREGMAVYNAMRETLSLSVKAFNPVLMRAFLEKLALYPVRSLVELNTGQMAIVVGTNDRVPFRPVIKIISDNEKRKTDDLQIVNLMGDESLYVVGVLKEEDHNVRVVDEF